jgi:broad specificity phosphatase PhoE
MIRLVLARHGHVEGIEPARFRGRADLPLTTRGAAQAQALARRIAAGWQPTRIYTSPARRCVATAAPIAQACKLEPQVLDDLNDIDYGAWQGRTFAEAKSADPDLFATWFAEPQRVRFPSGESLQDLLARSADALRVILAQPDGGTVIAVAHDSVNRALLIHLLDHAQSAYWRFAQHPCCINEFEIEHARIRALRINDTAHLEGLDGAAG